MEFPVLVSCLSFPDRGRILGLRKPCLYGNCGAGYYVRWNTQASGQHKVRRVYYSVSRASQPWALLVVPNVRRRRVLIYFLEECIRLTFSWTFIRRTSQQQPIFSGNVVHGGINLPGAESRRTSASWILSTFRHIGNRNVARLDRLVVFSRRPYTSIRAF